MRSVTVIGMGEAARFVITRRKPSVMPKDGQSDYTMERKVQNGRRESEAYRDMAED